MLEDGKIFIGKSTKPEYLDLKLANRHGLITGATGTGKTVSLQVLAEGFSNAGVPVFAADIKGDLSGIAAPGNGKEPLRQARQGDRHRIRAGPVSRSCSGTCSASRATGCARPISEMGPLLLSRLLDLNDTQEGVLNIAFRIADEQGLLLLDLKDLRALLQLIADNAQASSRRPTATCRRPPSARSSASSSCWRTSRATSSSASRRSTSRT